MNIDWAALGQVSVVSLVATVAIVGVFTLGIVGSSAKRHPQADGAEGATVTEAPTALARALASLCFAVSAAVVAYGIYLIVA